MESTGRKLVENQRKKLDFRSWIILYMNVGLFIFLALTRPNFLTYNNLHSIAYETSFLFFASVGFTLLIIMGELDLSVGSLFGFGGSMLGLFVFSYKMPAVAAIPLAMVLAALIGYIVGILVTRFRINSMMVTIGVMMAVKGLNWMLVNKFMGRQLPSAARSFVTVNVLGVSWVILLMVVVAAAFEIFLSRSRHLRQLYYIGQNSDTTVIYGLSTNRIKCLCFALSAMLSTFGGALMTARVKAPNVTIGAGLDIKILTAIVISGASIYGGKGSVVRSMLGVLFIFMLQNGMTAYGIDSYIQQIIIGAILILAIYLDIRVNAKKA